MLRAQLQPAGGNPLHAQYVQMTEVRTILSSTSQTSCIIIIQRSLVRHILKMKLLVATEDYCLLKIRLALALTGKECTIETGVSVEDLTKLDAGAKAMLLESSLGYITQHIAILRSIAGSDMIGSTDLDRSMVDQWLEFSWQELGKQKVYLTPRTMLLICNFLFKIQNRGSCANSSQS